MVYCFKPIFDLLAFSKDKLLRNQVGEKLSEYFLPFVMERLSPDARLFVRKQLFNYASKAELFQSTRNIFYGLVESLDEKINDSKRSSQAPESSVNLIPLKSKLKKKIIAQISGNS